MAVTITVAQLSEALRLTVSGAPEPPALGIITRQLATAAALVNQRAPAADSDTQNEAVVRLVGWLYDQPASGIRTVQGAWSHSGAASLLAPYVVRRAEAV